MAAWTPVGWVERQRKPNNAGTAKTLGFNPTYEASEV